MRSWSRACSSAARVAFGASVALAALLAPEGARADAIDPTMPRTLVVGAPAGAAPSERLDAQRTGRTTTALPAAPVEAWRRHITGGLEQPPLVDAQGNFLLCLTVPEVLKLDPEGKEIWRARVGTAAPAVAPVLTSDGTLVVVTSSGQAWGLTPAGAVRFTTSLGLRGRDADAAPLALPDGGVVIAAGPSLVEIDRDGALRARTALEARPGTVEGRITGALLAGPDGATLFTTESGSVYAWHAPGTPRRLGGFGGFPRKGAMLVDARTLVAVVDNRRVVALDLLTGTAHVRSSGLFFEGPPALGQEALVLVASPYGLLFGLDAAGNEKLRVPIEKPPATPQPAAPAPPTAGVGSVVNGGFAGVGTLTLSTSSGFFGPPGELRSGPPLLVDPAGRIGFVRASGRAGVVSPEGAVTLASERVCASPLAVVPAGDRRMLIACHDGGLWLYGE